MWKLHLSLTTILGVTLCNNILLRILFSYQQRSNGLVGHEEEEEEELWSSKEAIVSKVYVHKTSLAMP
jgi:hypothetical protein